MLEALTTRTVQFEEDVVALNQEKQMMQKSFEENYEKLAILTEESMRLRAQLQAQQERT